MLTEFLECKGLPVNPVVIGFSICPTFKLPEKKLKNRITPAYKLLRPNGQVIFLVRNKLDSSFLLAVNEFLHNVDGVSLFREKEENVNVYE